MIDAAAAIAPENAIIAFLAPIRTPRVLDRPKGLRTEHSVFHPVTDDQNSVIKAAGLSGKSGVRNREIEVEKREKLESWRKDSYRKGKSRMRGKGGGGGKVEEERWRRRKGGGEREDKKRRRKGR